jgi:hypothetical protein
MFDVTMKGQPGDAANRWPVYGLASLNKTTVRLHLAYNLEQH